MKDIYWSRAAKLRTLERYSQLLSGWPVPYRRTMLETCQGKTFVLDCGDPALPPLLLFHGAYCNSLMWTRDVALWSQNFRVLSVDIIGDPGYSAPSRPAFSGDAHARWIDDIWDNLTIAKACVVGASLGGWLALDYAARRPERVSRLVALAPAGIVRNSLSSYFKIIPLLLLGSRGFKKAFEISFGLKYDALSLQERAFFDFLSLVQRSVISRTRLPTVLTDQRLRALTMPLRIVLGETDVFFDSEAVSHRLKHLLPMAEIICIPGAGHGLTDTTALVLDFLKAPGSNENGKTSGLRP
jgi:pimeloyl-ACP methyl ester carboxylesterase